MALGDSGSSFLSWSWRYECGMRAVAKAKKSKRHKANAVKDFMAKCRELTNGKQMLQVRWMIDNFSAGV